MKNLYSVIPKLNVALIISGFSLGGYLLMAMSRPYQVGAPGDKPGNFQSFNAAAQSLARLPQFSADAFKKSELFRSSGKKTPSQESTSFILLGVSMGDKKLAILQDTKAKKDYYCTEGDIVGNYTIKAIFRDKVVLEYEGNTLEITR
jgi:type II secretory pathway component PulC